MILLSILSLSFKEIAAILVSQSVRYIVKCRWGRPLLKTRRGPWQWQWLNDALLLAALQCD